MPARIATPRGTSGIGDEAAARTANTERRVQELLEQPDFREALEAALRHDAAALDPAHQDLIRRLREGEFATAALVSIYGAEFVERLEARRGE